MVSVILLMKLMGKTERNTTTGNMMIFPLNISIWFR